MYFVVDPTTGQKYGPADVSTLNQWAREGRVTVDTQIEEAATGQRLTAGRVPGLILNNPSAPPPTAEGPREPSYSSNYRRQGYGGQFSHPPTGQYIDIEANKLLTNAWVCIVGGLLCSCPLLPIGGLIYANRAQQAGHPTAGTARTIAIVLLCLYGLGVLFYIFVFAAMFASGGP